MERSAPTLDDLPWRASIRRAHHRRLAVGLAVALVVALVGYLAYTDVVRPALVPPVAAPGPITVLFGSPSTGTFNCAGTAVATETLPWASASRPVTTAAVTLAITEPGDGDLIGGSNPSGVATAQSPCAANPPTGAYEWYAVLQTPAGTNVATFSIAQGWSPVGGAVLPLTIANSSSVELISTASFADHGYALVASDPAPSPTVQGYSAL